MGLFVDFRVWFLKNVDTDETLQGQFPAENVTENVGSQYATHSTLNRQHSILQFTRGEVTTLSFDSMFFQQSRDEDITQPLRLLKSWSQRDNKLGRPPILNFWIGDGHAEFRQCVCKSVASIKYGEPTSLGAMRQVSFTVNLDEYTPFSLATKGNFETRYHNARQADYYEMLTVREYGDPMLGDVIRKRHPTKPNIQVGDIIKLPSIEAVRRSSIVPTSIPLADAFSRKDTATKRRFLEVLESRSQPFDSHVLQE